MMARYTIGLTICICAMVALVARAGATNEANASPIRTSVCDVSRNPAFFDGKLVSLRATVASGFEVFAIRSPEEDDCGGMWLEYSEGGPTASTTVTVSRSSRPPITLINDRNFKHFQSLLRAEMHPRTRENGCMNCPRYEVTATMLGRVDFAGDQMGYGHMNGYKLQFELMAISEIAAKDISSRYDAALFSAKPVRLPTGYIEGRLVSPNGKAYEDVWVTATRRDAENEFQSTGDADTDKRGHFKIDVPPGEYIVGVNVIRPASEPFPFRTTYAPMARSFSTAKVYKVADGEHVRADIYLNTPLAARSIPVAVQWPDGRPVEDANVWLTEASGDANIVVNTAVSHTKADGTFTLNGVVETDYVVHADIYLKPGYKKFCGKDVVVRADDNSVVAKFVLDRQGADCK